VSGVGSLKAGVKIGPGPKTNDGSGIGGKRRRVMLMVLKKQLKKNRKGFTLVEVIVVLVILAILAAIAIPALTGYIDKANEKKVLSKTRTTVVAAQTIVSEGYGTSKSAISANDIKIAEIQRLTGDSSITSVSGVVISRYAIYQLAVEDGAKVGYFGPKGYGVSPGAVGFTVGSGSALS
jgi:type IV pilus assembly protein PilA